MVGGGLVVVKGTPDRFIGDTRDMVRNVGEVGTWDIKTL